MTARRERVDTSLSQKSKDVVPFQPEKREGLPPHPLRRAIEMQLYPLRRARGVATSPSQKKEGGHCICLERPGSDHKEGEGSHFTFLEEEGGGHFTLVQEPAGDLGGWAHHVLRREKGWHPL